MIFNVGIDEPPTGRKLTSIKYFLHGVEVSHVIESVFEYVIPARDMTLLVTNDLFAICVVPTQSIDIPRKSREPTTVEFSSAGSLLQQKGNRLGGCQSLQDSRLLSTYYQLIDLCDNEVTNVKK
jgi:hypothetical protein